MTLHQKIKWFFGLFVLANVIIVLMVALGAFEPAPPKPMPNPNGYDDFVKAGKMLKLTTNDFSTMTEVELAALVATNAPALKLLRIGLSRECRVPNDYSTNYEDRLIAELSSIKELALNLRAEGKLAEMQNRTNDMLRSYLDAVTLGERGSLGGTMISKLVGIRCESIGRSGLQPLVESLNSQQCHLVAKTLEVLDEIELPAADVLSEETAFMNKILGTFGHKLFALAAYKLQQESKSKFLAKYQKNQLARRQMMIDFAARAYQLDKGKPPAAISDLVPDYLKALPKDPVTGSNLVLRASAP